MSDEQINQELLDEGSNKLAQELSSPLSLEPIINILQRVESGELPQTEAERIINNDKRLSDTIRKFAGREIVVGNNTVAFGQGSNLGDISIRNPAGRDVINITVQVTNTGRDNAVAEERIDTIVNSLKTSETTPSREAVNDPGRMILSTITGFAILIIVVLYWNNYVLTQKLSSLQIELQYFQSEATRAAFVASTTTSLAQKISMLPTSATSVPVTTRENISVVTVTATAIPILAIDKSGVKVFAYNGPHNEKGEQGIGEYEFDQKILNERAVNVHTLNYQIPELGPTWAGLSFEFISPQDVSSYNYLELEISYSNAEGGV